MLPCARLETSPLSRWSGGSVVTVDSGEDSMASVASLASSGDTEARDCMETEGPPSPTVCLPNGEFSIDLFRGTT